MKKALLVPALAITLLGGALVTASSAQAFWGGKADQGEFTKTLAQHLGVSEEKVQEAFSKMREEAHQKHLENLTKRLDTLVAEGKLTEAQKQAVLTKFGEMREDHLIKVENGETPENRVERKQQMEAHKTELEAWAKEQGIDLSLIMPNKPMMIIKQ